MAKQDLFQNAFPVNLVGRLILDPTSVLSRLYIHKTRVPPRDFPQPGNASDSSAILPLHLCNSSSSNFGLHHGLLRRPLHSNTSRQCGPSCSKRRIG